MDRSLRTPWCGSDSMNDWPPGGSLAQQLLSYGAHQQLSGCFSSLRDKTTVTGCDKKVVRPILNLSEKNWSSSKKISVRFQSKSFRQINFSRRVEFRQIAITVVLFNSLLVIGFRDKTSGTMKGWSGFRIPLFYLPT